MMSEQKRPRETVTDDDDATTIFTLPDPTNVQSVGRQTNPALQSGRMPPLIEDPDDEDDTNQLSHLHKNK